MELFASCAAGLEQALADELAGLGAEAPRVATRGVGFRGSREVLMRANLASRIASRVLVRLGEFDAPSRQRLYDGAAAIDWARLVPPGRTIAVDASGGTRLLTHTGFVAQVVKDAVCDRIRAERGSRPDVDRRSADVPIAVRLAGERATLALDSSGPRLHRRGYRIEGGEAPLKENLAAGILALAGYSGGRPLLDPMCGSGTFVIEAALAARRLPPGLGRLEPAGEGFAFQRWPDHDPPALERLARELEAEALASAPLPIVGSDSDERMVALARRNAGSAGVGGDVRIERRGLEEAEPPGEGGLLVANPPYGERLGSADDLPALYRALGDVLKRRFAGHDAWVLAGDLALGKTIGLRPRRRIPLWNGPIECRLLHFELYSGSRRARE